MQFKKPKFWDYKKPNIYSYLLLPIAILIQIIVGFKTKSKIHNKKIKTICVGNIYIGGTGKTSLCIKINEIFNKNRTKSCFIKKYYKDQNDEQKLLKKRGKLFLSSRRLEAVKQAENENYEVAILDDGLQDNSIDYDLSIVCFNNINWIGNGLTIPAGPLREDFKKIKNYQHIFLNGNFENFERLKKQILKINSKINIHTGVYKPVNLNEFNKNEKYLVFSGIGNHHTFISMLKKYDLNICEDLEFPDHYTYKDRDIKNILDKANNLNCKIITTEKDYSRIEDHNLEKIQFVESKLELSDEKKLVNTLI
jgi:tetraacyldisaccharide 4'-kinase